VLPRGPVVTRLAVQTPPTQVADAVLVALRPYGPVRVTDRLQTP
jgi:hypothetical protein